MANTAALLSSASLRSALQIEPQLRSPSLPALPFLKRGLPHGAITEITGRRSSGRTATVFHILAEATGRGEICAVIDTSNQFHPASAAAAGVKLARVFWVQCSGNAEHAFRAADLLLHAGGFGIVVLDLCEVKASILSRIPLSYWYRFRRAIEHTPTSLLICASSTQAKASFYQLELKLQTSHWDGAAPFCFLQGLEITASLHKPAGGHVDGFFVEAIA